MLQMCATQVSTQDFSGVARCPSDSPFLLDIERSNVSLNTALIDGGALSISTNNVTVLLGSDAAGQQCSTMLLVHITSSNLEHNHAREGAGGAISAMITLPGPPTYPTAFTPGTPGQQPYLAPLAIAIVISGSTLSNNVAQSAGAVSLQSIYNGSKEAAHRANMAAAVCGPEGGGAGSLLGFLDFEFAALLWPETSSCQLEMKGGTVIDGNRAVNGSGGSIMLAGCAARIHGCRISNNSATQGGGGLAYMDSGLSAAGPCSEATTPASASNQARRTALDTALPVQWPWLVIQDTQFDGNVAATGGGLHVDASMTTVFVRNCSLSNNTVAGEGGGMLLLVDNSKLVDNIVVVVDTVFDRNQAKTRGGAVSLHLNALLLSQEDSQQGQQPSVVIVHSNCTDNIAGTDGGGVHVLAACGGQLLVCNDTTFINNTAAAVGGAISVCSMGSNDSMVGNTICSTTAGLVLESAVLLYNFAQNGGGLHLAQGATAIVNGTMFQENKAGFVGGAIASVDCGLLTLTDSCITGCSAGLLGGGIYADACMLVLVERSQLKKNRAAIGGGVYLSGTNDTSGAVAPVAIFSHVNFSENAATLYHANTNVSMVRQVVSQYLGHGGGIFVNGHIGLAVSNNTVIYGNSASSGTVLASAQVCLSIAIELLPCEVGTELEMPSQADPSSWTTCSTCRRDQLGLWIDQRRPVAAINTSSYLMYMNDTNMQLLSNNGSEETNRAFCLACPADAVCPGSTLVVPKIGFWHSAANSPLIHRCPQPQACGVPTVVGDAWHWHDVVTGLRRATAALEAMGGLVGSTAAAINLDIIFSDNRSLALGLCQQLWHSYSPMQQLLVATRHNVSATTFNALNLPPCAMLAASTPASLEATSYVQMQCATGYTGNLCATCKPGYSLNNDYQCTPCPAMPRTVGVGLLAFIGTVVFTLYTCSSNLGQQHADAMEAHAVSSLDVLKV
ncbi:hypothetical protein TSOC_010487 [Tetrabaena socialis]|uniref:Right handed beta helix domain-containing protein n=1 Tax=Tetrabaena socialis TaxID=47790 RepID=A0A2J7ZT60_9CHLO|nr:hypothetical protein TSOC_010487 [Tetrabaena socialis]|eukprot:PNH03448.1 hypothetical protein TSOC_010487 [Tetrabaena socialis]